VVGVFALVATACSSSDPSGSGAGGTAGQSGASGFAGQIQQMGNGPPGGAGSSGMVGAGGTLGTGGIPYIGNGGTQPLGNGGTPLGNGGTLPAGGTFGAGGMLVTGGATNTSGGAFGMGGTSAGGASAGGMPSADGETGRMVGMTAEHNVIRAAVSTQPPLPPLTWSPTLAAYAQMWADTMAMTACMNPHHRTEADLRMKGYGENLAAYMSTQAPMSTAKEAVDGWAGEKSCWTFGTITGTEKCDMACTSMQMSDGCGHYTQEVWRNSTELGCGVSTCQAGVWKTDIWICNYAPAGNVQFQAPY
jgi:hypothetical protein